MAAVALRKGRAPIVRTSTGGIQGALKEDLLEECQCEMSTINKR